MRKFVFLSLGTVVLMQAWSSAQQPPQRPATPPPASATAPVQTPGVPPPTFKVEINYVEVDAVVTDRDGRLVNDLTRDDFQVFEDGKPQKVELFTKIDMPVTREDAPLPRTQPIEPGAPIVAESGLPCR